VNEPLAPKLVRNALLYFLVEAAEVMKTPILYVGDDELQVSPRDLAFMLCIAERHNLNFERGGIIDDKGEFFRSVNKKRKNYARECLSLEKFTPAHISTGTHER
jgi:hypothetical protein